MGRYLGSPNGVTNGPLPSRLSFAPDAVPDRAAQISIVDVTILDRIYVYLPQSSISIAPIARPPLANQTLFTANKYIIEKAKYISQNA